MLWRRCRVVSLVRVTAAARLIVSAMYAGGVGAVAIAVADGGSGSGGHGCGHSGSSSGGGQASPGQSGHGQNGQRPNSQGQSGQGSQGQGSQGQNGAEGSPAPPPSQQQPPPSQQPTVPAAVSVPEEASASSPQPAGLPPRGPAQPGAVSASSPPLPDSGPGAPAPAGPATPGGPAAKNKAAPPRIRKPGRRHGAGGISFRLSRLAESRRNRRTGRDRHPRSCGHRVGDRRGRICRIPPRQGEPGAARNRRSEILELTAVSRPCPVSIVERHREGDVNACKPPCDECSQCRAGTGPA
jgi:hypothetical protein